MSALRGHPGAIGGLVGLGDGSKPDRLATGFQDTQAATREANARGEGFKADSGKPDWTLFPFDGAEVVVRVLEAGARKYARDNWRRVPDAIDRYRQAGLRHAIADASGEVNDPETGLPHLAHAVCCHLFALALGRAKENP